MNNRILKKVKAREKHQKNLLKLNHERNINNNSSLDQFLYKKKRIIKETKIIDKSIRLNKLCKELNMSLSRVIEILKENNIEIDHNPNAKIDPTILKIFEDKPDDENTLFLDPTLELIEWIRKDIKNLNKINPENFENIICKLLERKGFNVEKCGKTNQSDGGIDIIAFKKDIVNFIIAIQVKHKKSSSKKIHVGEVRDFVGAMKLVDYFNAGMLITNSFFTKDSKILENKLTQLELKDSNDIQNWLKDSFISSKRIDKSIELTSTNKINLNF